MTSQNGIHSPVLPITQIMKYIMLSAAAAEMAALFLTAGEMVSLQNTLDEIGWKQPGYTNQTIVSKKSKQWHLRLRCLRCKAAHGGFGCTIRSVLWHWLTNGFRAFDTLFCNKNSIRSCVQANRGDVWRSLVGTESEPFRLHFV